MATPEAGKKPAERAGYKTVLIPEERYEELVAILKEKGKKRRRRVEVKNEFTLRSGDRSYDVKAALAVRDDLAAQGKVMAATSGGPGFPGAPCTMMLTFSQPTPGQLLLDFGCQGQACGPGQTCVEMGASVAGLGILYCRCE